jgi:cell wall assembly regulator SMI1
MSKINILDSENPIYLKDLNEFEKKVGRILPENYKSLLLKYNGGVEAEGDKVIDCFYSIKYGTTTVESAINILQIIEKTIPVEYLPFGNTGTGNEITIYLNEGDDYGKIFLFRPDELEPIVIANTLEELLGVASMDEF